jgi:hypothetical protein
VKTARQPAKYCGSAAPRPIFCAPSFQPVRLIMILVSCLMLHGCVGLGAWTLGSRTESSDTPYISPARGTVNIKATSRGDDVKTGPELRTKWGEPDQIVVREDGKEEWVYETSGWRWHGAILYAVVVPVPAMIPWGTQYVSFLVNEGNIESATLCDWYFKAGAYCGFFGMMYGGWGCGAGSF